MQGFNMGRYVPPDQEGLVTSGNKLHGVRAQKTNAAGVPIVRFEMPFAVWCDGCQAQQAKRQPVLIGQGVRFNAEKHRTGAYHSTPIWTFRMRHPACGTWLAIRTDPANTAYVVESGGRRRREYDDDDDEGEQRAPGDGDDGGGGAMDRLDAFDRLERTIAHRAVVAAEDDDAATEVDPTATTSLLPPANPVKRIRALARASERQWQDPYARNRALRAAFRAGRHAREQAAADDDALRQRLGGLGDDLKLLPATDADARHAALMVYGSETPAALADRRALARPLFGGPTTTTTTTMATTTTTGTTKTTASPSATVPLTQAARRRQAIRDHLAATVVTNTRIATDPFLAPAGSSALLSTGPSIRGRVRPKRQEDDAAAAADDAEASWKKRRRRREDEGGGGGGNTDAKNPAEPPGKPPSKPSGVAALALVNYESD